MREAIASKNSVPQVLLLLNGEARGSGDGQFKYPKGIAVDSEGNVYVADSGNNRIQSSPYLKNE